MRRFTLPATRWAMVLGVLALQWGCGDRCEQLCQQTAARLAECKPDEVSWAELGAVSRSDHADRCRRTWDRGSVRLSTTDMRLALEACADASPVLESLSCEELLAIYLSEE